MKRRQLMGPKRTWAGFIDRWRSGGNADGESPGEVARQQDQALQETIAALDAAAPEAATELRRRRIPLDVSGFRRGWLAELMVPGRRTEMRQPVTVFLRPNRIWNFWSRKLQRPVALPHWRSRIPPGEREIASQLATEIDGRSHRTGGPEPEQQQ